MREIVIDCLRKTRRAHDDCVQRMIIQMVVLPSPRSASCRLLILVYGKWWVERRQLWRTLHVCLIISKDVFIRLVNDTPRIFYKPNALK